MGIEENDYEVDLRTGWRFHDESRRDLPTASSSSTNWDRNNWKTSSWNSKHSSWSDGSLNFYRVRSSFDCLEKNFQTIDGRVNRTPTQTACTDAHSVSQHILKRMITFHHANTRDSRLRIFVFQNSCQSTCHVSFFAAPDTDHKHKFFLTYLTYLSDVLSLTPKSFGARSIFTLRRSTTE